MNKTKLEETTKLQAIRIRYLEKQQNQVAIEQLEKVKYYAQHTQGGLINYIDEQIKELKENGCAN